MSEEQTLTMIKGLEQRMGEVEFLVKVLLNQRGMNREQIKAYRKLDEQGELQKII